MPIPSTSGILYVRAALKPFARPLREAGGVLPFLRLSFDFDELLVPHFYRARPFWRPPEPMPRTTTSGALGTQVRALPGAVLSRHPTHAFAGLGARVAAALAAHDETAPCFAPIRQLAQEHDFSMLLLGCVDSSPGFSTVHVAQHELGLTRRHLARHVLRWDFERDGRRQSITAPELPGCSLSFDKFYPLYEREGNLRRGEIAGAAYVFIPSARRALDAEREVLRRTPRFVECGRPRCVTCRLRTY